MATRHPLAFCPRHGLFAATAIAINEGAAATFIGCGTNCPACGAAAEIIPGLYQPAADRMNLLVDPSISLLALGAIRNLVERLQAGKITEDDAKREAEKIHPGAGKLFDIAHWSDQAKATLYAAIIGAVAVIVAARIASNPSQTAFVNPTVIERVINPSAATAPIHERVPRRGKHPKKHR
jgi:hypothetical protein